MKKKIAIDLDKTLFNCNSLVYSFLNQLNFNKAKILKHKDIQKGIYKSSVLNKVFKLFNPKKYYPYKDAIETINELYEKGYEIHLVSNRPEWKPLIAMTIESLKLHGLKYHKLIMGCNNKLAYAEQENLDYFIDNDINLCLNLLNTENTKPIYFNSSKRKTEFKLKAAGFYDFLDWKEIKGFLNNDDSALLQNPSYHRLNRDEFAFSDSDENNLEY